MLQFNSQLDYENPLFSLHLSNLSILYFCCINFHSNCYLIAVVLKFHSAYIMWNRNIEELNVLIFCNFFFIFINSIGRCDGVLHGWCFGDCKFCSYP